MRRAILCLGATALLAACGTEENGDGGADATAETIEIVETEFALEPATVELDGPGTYTFRAVNEGEAVHALEVEGHGVEEETGEIQPGESAELTVELTEPGEYELYCPVGNHKDEGMDGSVVVGGAAGGATTHEETTTEDETTTEEEDDDDGYR